MVSTRHHIAFSHIGILRRYRFFSRRALWLFLARSDSSPVRIPSSARHFVFASFFGFASLGDHVRLSDLSQEDFGSTERN